MQHKSPATGSRAFVHIPDTNFYVPLQQITPEQVWLRDRVQKLYAHTGSIRHQLPHIFKQHYFEFPEQKTIIIPTGADRMNMICSTTELKQLKTLLLKGRSSLEMAKLFVFYEN